MINTLYAYTLYGILLSNALPRYISNLTWKYAQLGKCTSTNDND